MRKSLALLWKAVVVVALIVVCSPMLALESVASEAEVIAKIEKLQVKFPQGKYWNHVGSSSENVNGWTESPCTCHGVMGVDHIYGTGGCVCNHFVNANHGGQSAQCMGFANKLGYDVFGNTTWTKVANKDGTALQASQYAGLMIGDIVRISDSHSVFVIAKSGNVVTVGEANYSGKCQISWTRTINLESVTVTYYEHADNYTGVLGTELTEVGTGCLNGTASGDNAESSTENTTTETPTTEATEDVSFTGWKLAADGENYQYFKSGKLQKKTWLTVKKKKYYVDSDGYRVTGFYDVKGQTYYFNDDGVMQKNKWFTIDGNTYHANTSGIVLKSQWLWYKNTLVYVTKDGSIAKNEIVKIGSKKYYFNSKGKRSKGFKKYKGKYYYCNSSGIIQKKKWITKGGKKYYLQKSGVRAQSKLMKIGKYKYYFNGKGQMVKNKQIIYDGEIYKADKKGHCKYIGDYVELSESEDAKQPVY